MPRFQGIPVEQDQEVRRPRFQGIPVEAEEPVKRGAQRSALQGATLGAGDEIAAGLTAAAYKTGEALGLLPESGQSLSEIYTDQAQREREALKQYREREPGKAFAYELGGGLLTGGAGASRLAGTKGIASLSPVKQAATIGAAEGATYGALSADPDSRGLGAATGAATGALGGGALQAAGNVAKPLLAPMGRRLREAAIGNPQRDARNFLAAGLEREGIGSIDEIIPDARGSDMATLADLSQSARGMLEGLVTDVDSREVRKLAKETLQKRNRQNQSRLFSLIDEDLGTANMSFSETVERLKNVRKESAGPLYKAAGQKPLKMTKYMQTIMDPNTGVPEVVDAVSTANRRLATKRAAGDIVTNIDLIDETKRIMDDQIRKMYRDGQNNRARDLVRVKNRILDDVDNQIPEYKAARNAYAGDTDLINAAELGTKILRSDVDYMDDMLRTMSDSEKGMFRVGAKKAIREKLMQAREGTNAVNRIASEINLDRMKRAFPSERQFNQFKNDIRFEANIFETERVLHNSATALRQAERQSLARGANYSVPDDFGNDMYSIAAKALKRIMNRKMSEEAKLELGKLVLTPINQLPENITSRINSKLQSTVPEGMRGLLSRMIDSAKSGARSASIAGTSLSPQMATE